MSKSMLGVVGLLCLVVACGSESGSGSPGADPASGGPPGASPGASALAAPAVKAASDDGVVKLSWAPVEGAASYDVARATSAGAEVVIANVKAPSFADTDVTPETTYFYTVTARNDAGPGAASAEVSAKAFSFDLLHMRHNAQVLRGVAEGGGALVAVGDGMRALRSADDGATWTDARVPGYGGLVGITYGAGKFVAVGDGGQIFTSADGLAWEARKSGVSVTLTGVAYGGKAKKRFVAIGDGATLLSSADGVAWTPIANNLHHTQATTYDYRLRSIAYGDDTLDYFVVTAANGDGNAGFAFYVPGDADLATWAPEPSGFAGYVSGMPINGVAFGKYQWSDAPVSSFHLVGYEGFWAHAEETAPGTLTFATVTAGTTTDTWNAIAFDGADTMKVFGAGGKVMTCSVSTSCKNAVNGWSEETVPATNGLWAATFAGSGFVGVGSDELVLGKGTGAGDTFGDLHRSSPSFTHLLTKDVAGVGNGVVAAGTFGGRYLYSSDAGIHFSSVTAPNNAALWGAKAIGGKIFMVGASSTIMSSPTGAPNSWSVAATTPTTETLRAVASSGTLFIAAGDKGAVFTSPDGATWTFQASAGHPVSNLEWDGTTFVATTSDGHVLTTTDGLAWNDALFDDTPSMSLEGLAIDGNTIVVTGREGHVWLSTNHGASFAPHHIAEAPALVGLARFAGKWIAAGSSNGRPELWTSEDAITWKRRTAIPSTAYSVSVAAGKVFVAGSRGAIYSSPQL